MMEKSALFAMMNRETAFSFHVDTVQHALLVLKGWRQMKLNHAQSVDRELLR